MYFKSIQIENFKSFWKNQEIKLEKGFNLFIGANNSGKTSALDALDLERGTNQPHRSINSLPEYGSTTSETSKFRAVIATNIQELARIVGTRLYLPIPVTRSFNGEAEQKQYFQELIANPQFDLLIDYGNGSSNVVFKWTDGLSQPASMQRGEAIYSIDASFNEVNLPIFNGLNNYSAGQNIGGYFEKYIPYVYRFSAQRQPAGISAAYNDARLDRVASNLPFCINHLQSNDAEGHKRLCELVNRVFPNVQWVQAPPINNTQFEVHCLPLLPISRREDLAVPLNRMGSGIGNVIAMLYVVLTARHPQVIAIDEPNSFLHPRALRELLQILAIEATQHQIILTAHSADVLTAIKPSLITMFDFDGATTSVKQVNAQDISLLRTDLSDLGIHMTDLHGRDRVLWVEGQTEEIVMPELLRVFCPEIAAGTAVLRVEHTGTFEKKGVDPIEVSKLYTRLSGSSALVPPMVAILLDRELHTKAECVKLEKKSNLKFLERRMLENYVLIPDAIAAVLNALGEAVTTEKVIELLTKLKVTDDSDLTKIDGAKVLKQIFAELTDARHEFKKTRDVPELISYLLVNQADKLSELGAYLKKLFKSKDKQNH
jgi:energy-coupling factor transporter ATP-binding protein EcfA2